MSWAMEMLRWKKQQRMVPHCPALRPRMPSSPLPPGPVAGSSGHLRAASPKPSSEQKDIAITVETSGDPDADIGYQMPVHEPPASAEAEDGCDAGELESGSPEAQSQYQRDELSYIDRADLAASVRSAPEEHAEITTADVVCSVTRSEGDGVLLPVEGPPETATHSNVRRPDSSDVPVRDHGVEAGPTEGPANETVDSRFDFPLSSDASEEPEDAAVQPQEWSFSVPQDEHRDERIVAVKEEDAAYVVRELSREPDEHDDERPPSPEAESEPQEPRERPVPVIPVSKPAPGMTKDRAAAKVPAENAADTVRELSKRWSRLAQTGSSAPSPAPVSVPKPASPPSLTPPPTRVPEVTFSPRNPFHTPAVAQTSASHQPAITREFRPLQTAPTPQFDLPDDDVDESLLDPGIVKITSSDPMAAARAAAILRLVRLFLVVLCHSLIHMFWTQHKYDCVETIGSPGRHPNASLESALKSARRKSILQSGVNKSFSRRGALEGGIGNTVAIDGTPRTSLTELLKEAEATVLLEESMLRSLSPPKAAKPAAPSKISAQTSPKNPRFEAMRSIFDTSAGPRHWSKADWKALDTCYTDVRAELAKQAGPEEGALVSAEDVDEEQVMARFVELMGGVKVVEVLGDAWIRYAASGSFANMLFSDKYLSPGTIFSGEFVLFDASKMRPVLRLLAVGLGSRLRACRRRHKTTAPSFRRMHLCWGCLQIQHLDHLLRALKHLCRPMTYSTPSCSRRRQKLRRATMLPTWISRWLSKRTLRHRNKTRATLVHCCLDVLRTR